MRVRNIWMLVLLMAGNLGAWYWPYWYPDIMASQFKPPAYFLGSSRYSSIGLLGLGEHFRGVYTDPLEEAFQNPAQLMAGPRSYLHLDFNSVDLAYRSSQGGWSGGVFPQDLFVAPRIIPPIPPQVEPHYMPHEPLARALFYIQPLKALPLKLGVAYEFFYDQAPFSPYYSYWPPWGWGIRSDALFKDADALIAEVTAEPRPGNTLTDKGHRLHAFLALQPLRMLSVGLRYAYHTQRADGYFYEKIEDDSQEPWYNDYHWYNEKESSDGQTYSQHDIQAGASLALGVHRLGLSVGLTSGDIARSYTMADTNFNYSYYASEYDTSQYSSSSDLFTERKWDYIGEGRYGELHWATQLKSATIRFTLFGERRRADLTEAESFQQHEQSYNRWYRYHSYDSTEHSSSSWHVSDQDIERTGTGEFTRERYRFSAGVEWHLESHVRPYYGLVVDWNGLELAATEPFDGSWSRTNVWESDSTAELEDVVKTYDWLRQEKVLTVVVPIGMILEIGKAVEVRVGIAPRFTQLVQNESWKEHISQRHWERYQSGNLVQEDQTDVTKTHTEPPLEEFISDLPLNSSISVKGGEHFRFTMALSNGVILVDRVKIGLELRW